MRPGSCYALEIWGQSPEKYRGPVGGTAAVTQASPLKSLQLRMELTGLAWPGWWVGGWVGEDLNPARVRDAVASLFILFAKVGNEGKESSGVLPLPMRPGEPGQGSPSLSLPVLPIALFTCYPARTSLPDFPFCLLSPLPISILHLCLPSLSSPPRTSRPT